MTPPTITRLKRDVMPSSRGHNPRMRRDLQGGTTKTGTVEFFSTVIVAVVAGSPIGDRCNQNRVIWRMLIYTVFWPLLKAYGLYCRPPASIDGLWPLNGLTAVEKITSLTYFLPLGSVDPRAKKSWRNNYSMVLAIHKK